MEPKILSSQVLVKPHQMASPPRKVLMGCSRNFERVPEHGETSVRPLMVNAWSQTTSDDFNFLHELDNKDELTKREQELLEKISILESDLKTHSELLLQIHATSARTSSLLGNTASPPQVKSVQMQSLELQPSNQAVENATPPNPEQITNRTSPTNSVMNPLQHLCPAPKGSVKYTIIAEGSGDGNDEPIEIQLAEEDGALNLSSSPDSGKLEICLAREKNIQIKTETVQTPAICSPIHNDTTVSTGQNFIKRRKLEIYQNDALTQNSNYCNQQVMPPPSNGTVIANNFDQHHPPKKRSTNSLLKSINKENSTNTNSPQIQTTPIHSLMPSSSNSLPTPCNSNTGPVTDMSKIINTDHVMVSIGPNNTRIPAKIYDNMNWSNPSIATRRLLVAAFDRHTLATHSMTGKPSPAFKDHDKPLKQMLNPMIIQDIIFAVTKKCNATEKEVRNAITTKCADENKMMKLQKKKSEKVINKENIATEDVKNLKSEL